MTNSIDKRIKRLRSKTEAPFGQKTRRHGDNRRVKLGFNEAEWTVDETGFPTRSVGEGIAREPELPDLLAERTRPVDDLRAQLRRARQRGEAAT